MEGDQPALSRFCLGNGSVGACENEWRHAGKLIVSGKKRCYGICDDAKVLTRMPFQRLRNSEIRQGEGQTRTVENRRDVRMIKLSDVIDYRWWICDNRSENDERKKRLLKILDETLSSFSLNVVRKIFNG